MTRPVLRAALAGATALALAGLPAVAATAAPGGDRGPARTSPYLLGSAASAIFPEGITVEGRFFYVSSTTDGAVLRGDLRRPDEAARVFLPGGEDGRTTARGLDATKDLLLVAGGPTGTLFVYDRASGELLSTFSRAQAFLNDVRIAPDGDVYATDSTANVVYRVPADELLGTIAGELDVFARLGKPAAGFNANGLAVTPDGRFLIVVQSVTGQLFRISTDDGSVRPIDLGGATVMNGDGIVLQGRTLYVVRNSNERVTEVRLSGDLTSGRVVETVSDPSFAFPTTAALANGRLLVVNSQFNRRSDPRPFTVTSLKRP